MTRRCEFVRLLGFACAGLLFAAASGMAEDRLRYRDASGSEIRERSGTLLDWTDGQIAFQVPGEGGGTLRLPAERIVDLEFDGSAAWTEGRSAFREGRWTEAYEQLDAAYRSEERPWAKLEIRALLIRCATAFGRHPIACNGFRELIAADPSTRHVAAIPLPWIRGAADPSWESAARTWLTGTSEWDRLLGAAWLLNGVAKPQARAALVDLTDSRDERIRYLARFQLLRDDVTKADAETLDAWNGEIELGPIELRSGPRWLVAEGRSRLAPGDDAALAYLRFALDRNPVEAWEAEGLLGAARQLTTDHPDEARRLVDELERRFPQSDATRLARQLTIGTP